MRIRERILEKKKNLEGKLQTKSLEDNTKKATLEEDIKKVA